MTTPSLVLDAEEVARVADGLSPAMRNALKRLSKNMVYIDGRSRLALIRRGLAVEHGRTGDELFGSIVIVFLTAAGKLVVAHLLSQDTGK